MRLGTVLTWYKYDLVFSTELIDSFVAGIEKQVADSIVRYETTKERYQVPEVLDENDDRYLRVFETHQGLDDETWDLANIFREYFPNLQRRSGFLTIYGYFEHELHKLCLLYQSEKHLGLSPADLKDRGIDRSIKYLGKVAGLPVHEKSDEWDRLKKIQSIRNVIAHQDGKLRDDRGRPLQAVINTIAGMKYVKCGDEIILLEGFLSGVVDAYRSYFSLINSSIEITEREQKEELDEKK